MERITVLSRTFLPYKSSVGLEYFTKRIYREAAMKKLFLLLISFLFTQPILFAQVNLDSGLVAFYPFQGNANDESGNANNGTVIGAVLTTDRFGYDSSAYEFDGTSSYITVLSSPSLESPDTELTQAAWIDIYGWSLIGQLDFGPITMKSNSGANSFQYRLSVGEAGINTAINNWNNSVLILDTLNFNEWYFIVTTLKDDTVKAYVNGILIGADTLNGTIDPDNRPLEIGRDVPGLTEVFNGKIDDLRIYNRALNTDEIDSLFNTLPTSVNVNNSNLPLEFELEQNYPNPFNPNTTIKFTIPSKVRRQTSNVTLIVYDILGNEIATLVDDEKQPGIYAVVFKAGNLPGGIYFYKFSAENFIDTKKLLLLK